MTPTTKDGNCVTLMASHRPRPSLEYAITTKYFPQPHILSVWYYADEAPRGESDEMLMKAFWLALDGGKSAKDARFRYNGKVHPVYNGSRETILSTIKALRPHEFLRLRCLMPKEALRLMGV